MPVVGLIRAQLGMVLIHRDPHRPRTQSGKMAGERAQRPRGDALHQRVGRIVVAQATGDGEGRGRAEERRVTTRYPAPFQAVRRPRPVEGEADDNAACIGIVGQHITHRHGIVICVVGEGDHDVVLFAPGWACLRRRRTGPPQSHLRPVSGVAAWSAVRLHLNRLSAPGNLACRLGLL